MKKQLLIFLVSIASISASIAQSIPVGAPKKTTDIKKHQLVREPFVEKKSTVLTANKALISSKDLNIKGIKGAEVISTSKKGNKEIQFLKNKNGKVTKKLISPNSRKIQEKRLSSISSTAKSTSDFTFFESFEGWDGKTQGWIPEGWSKNNKTEYLTWDVWEESSISSPVDGKYLACVDLFYDFEEDVIITDPRDEMLITPAFTPVEGDHLYFDLNYSALFMFLDFNSFELVFDDPFFNVQVLVTEENNENWEVIWDLAKEKSYSEDNIWNYDSYEWYRKMISLKSYAGKSIKIAYRYSDREGGDNIGLDNIQVRELNPTALYMRPQGFFKLGMDQNWLGCEADLLFGHAYNKAIWRNFSIESDAYRWEFDNPDGSGSMTSTEKNPNTPYPFDIYEIPSLTASGGKKSSYYQWGINDLKYLLTGGDTDDGSGVIIGAGNYDLSYDFYAYYFEEGDYLYGTSIDNSIDGVANYFEKPVNKYVLDGVWAALGDFSFPAGTEFKMVIRRVIDGSVDDDDIIATATCTTADVIAHTKDAYTMPFTTFITIDPETQLEIENKYIEIEDAILIEITGFNNIPGSKISFCTQEFNTEPTGESNAYLYVLYKDKRYLDHYIGVNTSLLINLEITYSFLVADSYIFNASEEGGEKTFYVSSFYSPDSWWMYEDFPEWINHKIEFNTEKWEAKLTFIADPLTASEVYREEIINIFTKGAEMSFLVKQGKNTEISLTKVEKNAKAVYSNNSFELSYSPEYSAISVYNLAGQKIAGYRLPDSGIFTIPTENYSKGAYILSFTGTKGSSTVKVIKQ